MLLILYAGFLKIALSSLLPTLATVLGAFINLLAQIMTKTVLLLAKVDILQIASHRPSPGFIIVLYALLAMTYFTPFRYRRMRQVFLFLLVFCFLFPGLSQLAGVKHHSTLEMTCLSVGHGQAIVVSTPGGDHFLFDGGSITHQRIAGKTIAPYLQDRRIFALDAVYISHGDLDHLNSLPDIAAMVPTRTAYGNAVLLENSRRPSLEQNFSNQLAELGLTLQPIRDCKCEDITIQSLWPPKNLPLENLSENDRCEVFLMQYASRKILLCGDIEQPAQQAFIERYPLLRVDVLILPHHGSTVNLDGHFVEQLAPDILIASCSSRNQPNAYHPAEDSDARCFYTSVDGAVTVKIKADGALSATGFLNSKQ